MEVITICIVSNLSFVKILRHILMLRGSSSLLVVTTHLDEAASRTDLYAGTAKKYLKDLTSAPVLKIMFLLIDVLDVITDLSKFFQTEDMLVLEVLPKVEAVILRLTSLKFHPGNTMREFMSKYNP